MELYITFHALGRCNYLQTIAIANTRLVGRNKILKLSTCTENCTAECMLSTKRENGLTKVYVNYEGRTCFQHLITLKN